MRASLALTGAAERRGSERLPVALPASISLGTETHTAKLINIVSGGAMIETRIQVAKSSRLVVSCGTINAPAVVVWTDGYRTGIKFLQPLSDAEVREQVSRCAALESRRRIKAA